MGTLEVQVGVKLLHAIRASQSSDLDLAVPGSSKVSDRLHVLDLELGC